MMAPPLDLAAAAAAVRRAVTGTDAGVAGPDAGAGNDSDDFVATSMIISLRCPLSGGRIVTPARWVLHPTMACLSAPWHCAL